MRSKMSCESSIERACYAFVKSPAGPEKVALAAQEGSSDRVKSLVAHVVDICDEVVEEIWPIIWRTRVKDIAGIVGDGRQDAYLGCYGYDSVKHHAIVGIDGHFQHRV